jgi:hypothetical protein
MSSDYEEICVLPTGVYRVRYKQLTLGQIKALRTRTQRKLQALRVRGNRLSAELNEVEAEMKRVQGFLDEGQNPEVDGYIQRYEEQKAKAGERAEAFLRDFLGEEGYAKFRKAGFLELQDTLGESWRIYADGTAMRWENGNFRRVCVIRQRELPLPDHIVSVVQTIRERSGELRNYRR